MPREVPLIPELPGGKAECIDARGEDLYVGRSDGAVPITSALTLALALSEVLRYHLSAP
jgi:hypothetical protein